MRTHSLLLLLLLAGFISFTGCDNSVKKDKAVKETMDAATTDTPPQPPVTNPPGVEMKVAPKKCYTNEGLKYKIVVVINFGETDVVGNITSEETSSGEIHTTAFEGKLSGKTITAVFKGTPPPAGDASEWTTKPWTIENKQGKEILHIVFNAKNYETNKWADMDYEFTATDCK